METRKKGKVVRKKKGKRKERRNEVRKEGSSHKNNF